MAVTARGEKRIKPRVPRPGMLDISLSFTDPNGLPQVAPGTVVDSSDDGLGLQIRQSIPPGTIVSIADAPALRSAGIQVAPAAKVCWCRPSFGLFWRIGLQYVRPSAESRRPEPPPDAPRPEPAADQDFYELLEISPKASPDTIQRVYRLLAQRFHPDNPDTGDAERFKLITSAYRTLSEPEQRAAYDAHRSDDERARWRIFSSPQSAQGAASEKTKRQAVIRALYLKRMREPSSPSVGMLELEDLLGIPRDHLEFTMWYLKERAMVVRSDNNRYQILVAGVDYAEQLEEEAAAVHKPLPDHRLLPPA